MNIKSNTLKNIGQVLIYTIILIFISKIFFNNWPEISDSLNKIDPLWASFSLLLIIISITFQGYIWHIILKSVNINVKFQDSFVTYFRSLITRYIPGGIWVFIARTYVTTKIGFNKQQSLYLIIVESVLAILSGSIVFLIFPLNSTYGIYLNMLALIIILLSIIFFSIPKYFINIFNDLFNKKISLIPIKWEALIKLTFLFFIRWLVIGLGFYCLCYSFVPLPFNEFFTLTGIFAISWVIGFVVLITPSGFGVREGAIVILLLSIVSLPIALIIALFARILFIIGEIINFLISTTIKLPD